MASPVTEFYRNKNIFMTGGTGFVGVGIIEKILRSLPDVGNVYLLMRPKRGRTIEERLVHLAKNEVFEKMLETNSPTVFQKLIPIAGDVSAPNLGISAADRQRLIDNVHVVIHSAATLDFNETLRPAVDTNLLGTRRVMELCAECRQLAAMVHISSAYANAFLRETEEILYPAPDDAERIIDLAHSLAVEALDELTPALLKDHPNSYTFTKHLAEHEVNKYADRFPCAIVRPSMICASVKDPLPGWTMSKNGPAGFIMGASIGVVRRIPLSVDVIYDYTPVDFVVNQVLVTAQHVHRLQSGRLEIYHQTSSTCETPFRWRTVADRLNTFLRRYPLQQAVWYPYMRLVPTMIHFKIAAIFVHFIPAYILDALTRLTGGKPILVRLHTNVWNSLALLERFIFTEWLFHNPRTLALHEALSDADKRSFALDVRTINWEEYFVSLTLGVRRYLSKEHPRTLEKARRKDKILFALHIGLQALLYLCIWALAKFAFGSSWSLAALVLPFAFMLIYHI